jgi:MoaA/NifB/PqqE/SkfB family radical SAM enzyme
MNLMLTEACDKGCNYCFNRNNRSNAIMSIKQVEWALSQPGNICKILGGEPTLHPDIGKIISMSVLSGKKTSLFSNLLFGDSVLEDLCRNEITGIEIIANATDLEIGNRKQIWLKNYNTLRNNGAILGISITVVKGQDYSWTKLFIEETKPNFVRLSTEIPVQKEENRYINDKEYGNIFSNIARTCQLNAINCYMDCSVVPCMFEHGRPMPDQCTAFCENLTGDLHPDWTISSCPATGFSMTVNVDSAYNDATKFILTEHWKLIKSLQKDIRCEGCDKYPVSCSGPCPAYKRKIS